MNITDQYDMILTDQDEVHTLKWTKYKNNGDGIGLWWLFNVDRGNMIEI